ncbi:MAG: hypothetical protein M0T83_04505 [Nitrospiraceae bacterium]|nr:hypothetical protein [Nitrospiraceae bacterium]
MLWRVQYQNPKKGETLVDGVPPFIILSVRYESRIKDQDLLRDLWSLFPNRNTRTPVPTKYVKITRKILIGLADGPRSMVCSLSLMVSAPLWFHYQRMVPMIHQ